MPSDSSFSHFDAKLMLSSFFAIVIIFGVLTGFGLLQQQIGDPPELASNNESLVDFDGPDFPEQPGTYTGECTWNTQVTKQPCRVFEHDGSTHTINISTFNVSGSTANAIVTTRLYYNASASEQYVMRNDSIDKIIGASVGGNFLDSDTWTLHQDNLGCPSGNCNYDSEATLDSNDISVQFIEGDYTSGKIRYTISYGNAKSGGLLDKVAQAVTFLGSVIMWFFEYIITLIITILTAIVKLTVWIVSIFWYLINGWIALNGLVNNQWFGLILQGITLALFIGFFNGTVKIIQIIW